MLRGLRERLVINFSQRQFTMKTWKMTMMLMLRKIYTNKEKIKFYLGKG